MSKADTLGPPALSPGRSSARRDYVRKLSGEDAAAAITELPVTVISANPDNPRNHLRDLDVFTEAVREVGVILPISVATTEAYLHGRADRAEDLDDGAKFVVIDGHRRLEASRRVGLATIPVRVDNSRVATDETLLEAAFIANYHRDDMTELEEANALRTLVDHYGSQTKAAKRLGIPQATLSTKLSLLKLAPQLQKDLQTGVRKVEHVRNLGKLTPQEQQEKADQRAAADAEKKAAAKAVAEPAPQPPPVQSSEPVSRRDNSSPDPAAGSSSGPAVQVAEVRVPDPRPQDDPPSVPEVKQPKLFPYDDALTSAQLVHHKMEPDTFLQHLRFAGGLAAEEHPEEFRKMLLEWSQQVQHGLEDSAVSSS